MPAESAVIVVSMVWICFKRQSTTIIMVSNPWDSRSSIIKSMVMICQQWSRTQFRWSVLEGLEGKVLVWLQTSQDAT